MVRCDEPCSMRKRGRALNHTCCCQVAQRPAPTALHVGILWMCRHASHNGCSCPLAHHVGLANSWGTNERRASSPLQMVGVNCGYKLQTRQGQRGLMDFTAKAQVPEHISSKLHGLSRVDMAPHAPHKHPDTALGHNAEPVCFCARQQLTRVKRSTARDKHTALRVPPRTARFQSAASPAQNTLQEVSCSCMACWRCV